MKSLLSNYFNRQQIENETKQNETTSSFSSLTSSSVDAQTQQTHNDSNIKYIDDIDTDGACYSSTSDDETDLCKLKSTTICSNETKQFIANQMKSNDTVIKTLEKISENFQFLFENSNEKIILNKQNLNTTVSLVDLKEWFSIINRVTKESQDLYKKKMEENKLEIKKKTSNDTQDEFNKLNEKIIDLTEKLNNMEVLNKQQKEEIDRMKDICESMRSDRKRLKSEKVELLNQAKELYNTIEAKENELRDFLRHYETKTKETSFAVKKLIDSKAIIEQEKIDLQTQLFELLEEKNELKLLVESKNATITKLQKQLFEMNTKSIRHSLSKESDYGYVSTKASRDTLSTSLIENLKLNDYDTSRIKLKNKEERMMKCKSNDYQQHQQLQQHQTILKSRLKNKSHQQFNEIKDCSSHSNSSNQSIIDYESDLNKVLDSEAFIDLDTSSIEKLNTKSVKKQETISQSYSSDCILSHNSNCMKQNLNKIDEKLNNSEETSCTSSVVSFTKSSSSNASSTASSSSVSNSPPSTSNSELESNSTPSSIMSQSLIVTNEPCATKKSKCNMSTSVYVDSSNKAINNNNSQSRSSRIINSLIKMSTTAATVGSTGSSINFESSAASKVPLFTSTFSSSKIKSSKNFNSTFSMNNRPTAGTVATTKSLYSICDIKSPSNGSIQQKQERETKEESNNEINKLAISQVQQQVTCSGLKNITMSCLKIDSLDKLNNVNEWPIERIRVWLEQVGMLQSQIKSGLKSIKNGKSLLNMNDSELERAFQLSNSLHKRKLRLALEELKFPEKCKYRKIKDLNTDWVCNTWLKDVGLVQLRSTFRVNLVDGRLLNSLTKKDLEKHFNINKRNIQISLLIGIEFLRKYEFDLEKLKSARDDYQTNAPPNEINLWTNEHFDDWLKLVNLQAFSRNLSESGLHGALVQDNIFTVDFLYSSLKVTDEPKYHNMKKILEDEIKLLKKSIRSEFKPEQFNRSYKQDKKLFTLRGSLGRALGKKIKRDISSPLIDDDTYRRIEFSHKIVDMKNVSTTSVV